MTNPIVDRIIESLKGLATLRIVTEVVDAGAGKSIETTISLIGGDITTRIDKQFITGDLAPVREFHNQQVVNGRETLVANITTLSGLADTIGERTPHPAS